MKFLATLFLACSFFGQALFAQISPAVQQRMQDTISYFQTTKRYKGISAAVSWKGHGEWKGTTGISYSGQPLTDSMVIGIGSNTKTFLASVILRLVELQSLSLSDSIGKWLPPMQNIKGSITISQLLHHTSGIYNYTENTALGDSVNLNPYRVWTKNELVTKFVKAPYFTPGNGWYYSNTNYLLAGMIAELAGGMNVADLVRMMVLSPAGLDNTFFPPYETVNSIRAKVWSNLGNGYLQPQTLPVEFYSVADAAGGMISDAADNCKFWVGLFNGDIISKSTVRNEMMNWVSVNSTLDYGLALMKQKVQGNFVYSHGGAILGQFCANLTDTVRGITVSVLTNQDSILNEQVVYGLYRILLQQSKFVGVDEQAVSGDLLFPNPAKSVLNVVCNSPVIEGAICDLTGRMLLVSETGGTELRFDLNTLAPGVYLVKLTDKESERVKKFVRE